MGATYCSVFSSLKQLISKNSLQKKEK